MLKSNGDSSPTTRMQEDRDDEEYDSGEDRAAAEAIDADLQMEAIEQSIKGTAKVLNDNEKPKRLTMQLIRQSMSMTLKQSAKRSIKSELEDETEDVQDAPNQHSDFEVEEIDSMLQKKVLRLDWMSLGRIENLDALTHVQELYLQHNLIRTIENLENHTELTFLALGGNRIEKVENINHLTKLKFLDLSNNCIEDFDIREFPPSLRIIRLAGNPFVRHMPAYMHLFFERLPNLTQIDQYRRMPDHLSTDSADGSPRSPSPLGISPRSTFIELETEVELSQQRQSPPARDAEESTAAGVFFSIDDYEKNKEERMSNWKRQLKDLETRKAELEGDIPMITRTTSAASMRTRRKTAISKAREATQAAIADSIAHFQQMELEHQEWREQQHQAA